MVMSIGQRMKGNLMFIDNEISMNKQLNDKSRRPHKGNGDSAVKNDVTAEDGYMQPRGGCLFHRPTTGFYNGA
jgi:hypothetical protein